MLESEMFAPSHAVEKIGIYHIYFTFHQAIDFFTLELCLFYSTIVRDNFVIHIY